MVLSIHEEAEDKTDWLKCRFCNMPITPGDEQWADDGFILVGSNECREVVDSRLSGRFTDEPLDESTLSYED